MSIQQEQHTFYRDMQFTKQDQDLRETTGDPTCRLAKGKQALFQTRIYILILLPGHGAPLDAPTEQQVLRLEQSRMPCTP